MKKNFFIIIIFTGLFCCNTWAQSLKLSAIYDASKLVIHLNWNMINVAGRTGYILLKSSDGINWTEAARDKRLRNYTEDDLYSFNDKNFLGSKVYYRLKIFDNNNRTVALSTIIAVPLSSKNTNTETSPIITQPKNNSQLAVSNSSWVLYPNPASNVLTLTYKGSGILKGVVNVQVQDASGKIVVKFRSGSIYKTIQVPISNLTRGIYFVQVTVVNELMMNQRFVKQ